MTTGYYSLIQFCPDPVRAEVVNIGVLLFCPAVGYLDLKLAPSAQRIRRAFGQGACDAAGFNAARTAIEKQVRGASGRWRELAELEQFAAIQGNAIRLAPPRQRLVREPVAELHQLFERLVGSTPRRKKGDVREVLDREFEAPVYEGLVRPNVEVVVPAIRRAVTLPYGYQNGRFNLIRPVRFTADSTQNLVNTVGGITFEGRELYENPSAQFGPLQLVVVAQFLRGQDDISGRVADQLRQNHVRLYRFDDIRRLFDDIQRTAKPLDQTAFTPVPPVA